MPLNLSRSNSVFASSPLAVGDYATIPIPNSAHNGTISASKSRASRLHSICTHVIGQTACARLMVSTDASESPTYLILPSLISSFIACIATSTGTSGSIRCKYYKSIHSRPRSSHDC